MHDNPGRVPRVVVGISRSPASWWALAWAIGEARRRGARLLLVHVYRPCWLPPPDDPRFTSVDPDPNADRVSDGNRLIWTAIGKAVGEMPAGLAFEEAIVPGRAAAELARLAHGGDVLVLGSRHRGWFRRHAPGSVARACARRAECPVLIVPEPSVSALAESLAADGVRTHWRRRGPDHQARLAS